MKKFLYAILHMFTDCPMEDLEPDYTGHRYTCKKCGRQHFIFKKY